MESMGKSIKDMRDNENTKYMYNCHLTRKGEVKSEHHNI